LKTVKPSIRVAAWPAFIETGNPYASLLYRQIVDLGINVEEANFLPLFFHPPDILHVHFPDSIMKGGLVVSSIRTLLFVCLLTYLKLLGTKIVWTVHNLKPHGVSFPKLSRWYWKKFTARLDGLVCLTEGGKISIEKEFPYLSNIPHVVTPHGHYKGHYKDTLTNEEARNKLDLLPNERVLLHFGNMRSYKNVPNLLRAFRKTKNSSTRLIIAGNAPGGANLDVFRHELEDLVDNDDRIDLHVRFIADDEVEKFFKACDLVVLPYNNIQNSGAAILALTFGRPVLVPNIGAMHELQQLCGEKWVYLYEGEISSEILEANLNALTKPEGHKKVLKVLGWKDIGIKTISFYRQLLN